MRGAQITGWGAALPEKVVTNHDLSTTLDTTHDWIVERTGIHERRVGGSTSGLAIEAGRLAMEKAGWEPSTVDLVILATTTPDQQVPASASTVQNELGLTCGAFDLNAVCSGFAYSLITAHGFIQVGLSRILVIGADTLSRITDWDDRGTAILFADGAGAVALEAVEGPGELLGWDLGSDGSLRHILDADIGGYLNMDGKEVFRRAVRVMVSSGKAAIERAGLTPDDVDLVIPHQANIRIIESACNKLGIPLDKAVSVLHRTGNTSAASIPLALADAADSGRLQPGAIVLLVGFGAGMTWASAVIRWNP
ncbi:MAG: ketoacyl-ACP synthase III [Acidimicrobiia bacterium]|nr:ketoacyl-ACP synthase III [Acidimicrobiia bacterium]